MRLQTFNQIRLVFKLNFRHDTLLDMDGFLMDVVVHHAQLSTHQCLGLVIYQRAPKQWQVAFMVFGKVFEEIVRHDQLKNCIAKKFQSLIIAAKDNRKST